MITPLWSGVRGAPFPKVDGISAFISETNALGAEKDCEPTGERLGCLGDKSMLVELRSGS